MCNRAEHPTLVVLAYFGCMVIEVAFLLMQVQLVHQQFLRTKGLDDPSDAQLYAQLMSVLDETHGVPATTQLEKLALLFKFDTSRAWKRESQALQGMKLEKEPVVDGIFDERGFEQAFEILNMLKALFPAEELSLDDPDVKKHQIAQRTGVNSVVQNAAEHGEGTPNIPDDFKCPISLDLMRDPVIVATGQVGSDLLTFVFILFFIFFTLLFIFGYVSTSPLMCMAFHVL